MKLVVANFKMNFLKKDIDDYISKIDEGNKDCLVICPPAIYLQKFTDNNFITGAQDIGFAEKGAYTGDLSILQLKELGISYAIVGHSERRGYYLDNRFVNKKIELCLKHDIIPVLCVGETLEINAEEGMIKVCTKEIDDAFIDNEDLDLSKVVVAYEPWWAVGTGIVPTNEIIEKVVLNIKKYVYNEYGVDIKVLYGCSVSEDNISNFEKLDCVDGYLIGKTSLKPEAMNEIIKVIKGV